MNNIFVRLKLFSNGNLSMQIDCFKKTFCRIWITFKKCLFVEGSSGFNGWDESK